MSAATRGASSRARGTPSAAAAVSSPSVPSPPPPPPPPPPSLLQLLTRVQCMLIECISVDASVLRRASLVLRPVDYEEVIQERATQLQCGSPLCDRSLTPASYTGKYRLSLSQHRVYDVSEGGALFCSERCEQQSNEYQQQLQMEPIYWRQIQRQMGEMKRAEEKDKGRKEQQQLLQLQICTQEIPARAVPPPTTMQEVDIDAYAAVALAEKAKMQNQQHSTQQALTQKTRHTSTDTNGTSQPTARKQKQKNLPQHQHQDVSVSTPVVPLSSSSIQSESETRENMAIVRERAAVILSPFAQCLSFIIHACTHETHSLFTTMLSTSGSPSGHMQRDASTQSRQEALFTAWIGCLGAVCSALLLTPYKSHLTDRLKQVMLTMTLNQQIPAFTQAQWQFIVTIIISAIIHHNNTITIEREKEIQFIQAIGFTSHQYQAAREALLGESTTGSETHKETHPLAVGDSHSLHLVSAASLPSASLSSLPRELLLSLLSCLSAADLSLCSQLNSFFCLLVHPLLQFELDHHLSALDSTSRQRGMKNLGYRDAALQSKEKLMAEGFTVGCQIGKHKGWNTGYHKGVLAAVSIITHQTMQQQKHSQQTLTQQPTLDSRQREELWQKSHRVNAERVYIPTESDGQSAGNTETEQEASLPEYCKWLVNECSLSRALQPLHLLDEDEYAAQATEGELFPDKHTLKRDQAQFPR